MNNYLDQLQFNEALGKERDNLINSSSVFNPASFNKFCNLALNLWLKPSGVLV